MVSQKTVEYALDQVAVLERLVESNAAYRSRESLPDLIPSSKVIQTELFASLQNLQREISGRLTERDRRVMGAASLLTATLEGDGKDQPLTALGYALVLATQSQQGFTNEPAFQETTRYLLAQNGYTPVQVRMIGTTTHHFFMDDLEKKVVVLSSSGAEIHTAELRSKYHLDEFVDDFGNYKKWSCKALEEKFAVPSIASGGGPLLAGAVLGSSAAVVTLQATQSILAAGIVGMGSCVISCWATLGFADRWQASYRQQFLEKQRATFPHLYLHSGAEALIDAFPFEENEVLSAEKEPQADSSFIAHGAQLRIVEKT